ncbi:retrovirus-related Pol polyprotein from transposon 297 [Caerostris extrusa]|uniref:Retrovirus-related Pol polyprotein from transposon 297 n=1 Tax=Caerostris extrusa TaxID=172846 RepID=A0AAV4QAJ2_CAEEX|nr:retrovirus-related Pol polyprotein from transposon 297 [Caerostris extrusa]
MLSVQGAQNSDTGVSLLQNASLMSMVPSLSGKKNDKELAYEKFKEAMTSHFKETPPLATEFAKFSSAVQFEFENVKDFSIRVQGLSQKCLESDSENEKVSEVFKEKLLSKFISGLKANIRAQVLITNPFSFVEAVDFALRVERSFEIASPNVNVISQAHSNTVEGVKEGFTKTLDLVLKQLEHLNTRIDELDKQKDIPENNYTNQPPSQRRDRKPLKCFYRGRLGPIVSECQRKKRRDYQHGGQQNRFQSYNQSSFDKQIQKNLLQGNLFRVSKFQKNPRCPKRGKAQIIVMYNAYH